MRLALDAMGGDNAPYSVIAGAAEAAVRHNGIEFLIFGDEAKIAPLMEKFPSLKSRSKLIHTEKLVTTHEKPSVALRQGKHSSMGLAIKAVEENEAEAAVSSGNTGALMAMAKFMLKTLPGIDRPAIGSLIPNKRGDSVMLDLGANAECNADNLFQFAVMGDAFAKAVLGRSNPSIGLLNIGSEESKGIENVKLAAMMLKDNVLDLNFHGFVEGNDIPAGTVDVIVTDGFSGNIALKTLEGTAKFFTSMLKTALSSSVSSKAGALLARPALKSLFSLLDPRMHNGAMFLGLNGIVVKSHGGTDEIGFANAIEVAVNLVSYGINRKIIDEMEASSRAACENAPL